MLPVPDGGALALPGKHEAPRVALKSPALRVELRRLMPFLLPRPIGAGKHMLEPLYTLGRRLQIAGSRGLDHSESDREARVFQDMPSSYYFNEKIRNWKISRFSQRILNKSNPDEIIKTRRRNYQVLYEALQDSRQGGLRPLFDDFPEGVCPLVMPAVASDPVTWIRELERRNISALRWWKGYHRRLSWEGFTEACDLKNRLLAFRVDQHQKEEKIEHVAQSIRELSSKLSWASHG
jgi:dTDP-4-amino-4,6-dideoxygalactose transaminase